MTLPVLYYLSVFLFCLGLLIVVTKRNAIVMLMGVELMLNAANLQLITNPWSVEHIDGQMTALFIIVLAVCETAIGLAIILRAYHHYRTVVVDEIASLKEKL